MNADHDYEHRNKNVKGFGSYGDLMIRDRKMYVVPTPFHLVDGVAHQCTLILPDNSKPGKGFKKVGRLVRTEAAELIIGYAFDLRTNALVPEKIKNPGEGKSHDFLAWRLSGSPVSPASMRQVSPDELVPELDEEEGEQ